MSFDADKLYELLPAVHRVRDAQLGYPLKQLIGVIADQVAVVQENLDQLYDNNFVETAAPWALPYIGDLLGIRGLSGSTTLTRAPRSEVGHTIAYRRRKGTAAMLELLARDITGCGIIQKNFQNIAEEDGSRLTPLESAAEADWQSEERNHHSGAGRVRSRR